ncbi:MAG: hypothetical protein Fur0023_14590 [Bacteroidia bacterium]
MGKGIKKKNILTMRSGNVDVVVPIELNSNEMQLARIGSEILLTNASGINDGDYIQFELTWDSQNNVIVADKPQRDPNIKSTVYNNQTIDTLTVNPDEAVLITGTTVTDKIIIKGGILVIGGNSTIEKIKDEGNPSSVSMVLLQSTVNKEVRLNETNNVVFVANGSAFNDNVVIAKNDPTVLCVSDCRIKKLAVK